MSDSKKNFKVNPAFNFISQESIDAVEKEERKTVPGIEVPKSMDNVGSVGIFSDAKMIEQAGIYTTRASKNRESKSKRMQILIQPSLHATLQRKAGMLGISVNEAVSEAVKLYVSDM